MEKENPLKRSECIIVRPGESLKIYMSPQTLSRLCEKYPDQYRTMLEVIKIEVILGRIVPQPISLN